MPQLAVAFPLEALIPIYQYYCTYLGVEWRLRGERKNVDSIIMHSRAIREIRRGMRQKMAAGLCLVSALYPTYYSRCQKSFQVSTLTHRKIATSPRLRSQLVQVLPSLPLEFQLLINTLLTGYHPHRRRHLIALQTSGMPFNGLVSRNIMGRGWLLLSLSH